MQHSLLLAALVLTCFCVGSTWADIEDDQRVAASLLANGRIAEAEEIVGRLRGVESPDLQTLFLSGLLHIERGRYDRAASEFRIMLSRDPTLLRPRLELARALFLARDYQGARYHFEQVLAAPLPDTVRANVLGYIGAIRNRLPSFAFSAEIISDSNPKQATSSKIVEIAGQPFVLTKKSRAHEEYGLQLTGQAKVPLANNPSWYASGYIENYDYPGRDFDQTYIQAVGGKHLEFDSHELDLELGAHYAAYQGTDLYRGPLARGSYAKRLLPNLWAGLYLDARKFDYQDFPYLNGWQTAETLELRYAISTNKSFFPSLFLIQHDARDSAWAFDAVGVGARYVHEWKGGWITRLSIQYSTYRYEGRDFFFDKVRSDHEWRSEISIGNRLLAYRGFIPRLILGIVDHRSNINLYAFDRVYVRAGVTKEY
ncbi:MAG TPA: surface lipoprotein assembly modifier [Burkholderiales bacterium]|nr:surface lipoprotein assembly modifier [Burkholderiales bacterium]